MIKPHLQLDDFTIAGRSASRPPADDSPADTEKDRGAAEGPELKSGEERNALLQKRSPLERETRARERAIAQEEARHSIKNLRRAKEREVKFFVNVALDQATKGRLKRAADENDIKMATVMKAAIDFYLKENGY